MQNGWITITRDIQDHWIFNDPKTFQMWVLLLMYVNWKDNKVDLGSKIVICKRGESFRSLRSWAEILNCGRFSLKTFFAKLQHDNMISLKTIPLSNHSRTRVTIINYDQYQMSTNQNPTAGSQAGQPLAIPELIKSNKDNKKEIFKNSEKSSFRERKNKVFFSKNDIARIGSNGQEFSALQVHSFVMKYGCNWENEGELTKKIKEHIKLSFRQASDLAPIQSDDNTYRGGGSRLKDIINGKLNLQ